MTNILGLIIFAGIMFAIAPRDVKVAVGLAAALVISLVIWFALRSRRKADEAAANRYRELVARWGQEIADAITAAHIWQGMTSDQLVESRGRPDDIANEVTQRGTRSVYKYRQGSTRGFRLRVTLAGDVVTGWKES
jgi:hypothetical protein